MADDVKRLNYFDGQFLRENDLNDEQGYHIQHQRDHARLLHTPGIAEGLDIPDPPAGATAVTVNAGVAFDDQGRRIVLANNHLLELEDRPANQAAYVTLAYAETQSDPTDETGISGSTRWTEAPLLETSDAAPVNPNEKLVLGRIERTGITVSGVDRSERRAAGVKGGDLSVRTLTFTSEAIAPSGWVRAQLGASGRADVGGSLRVTGNLTVDGTIQGDVAVNTIQTGDLVDNAVTSAKLAEADGSSGHDTNTGSGVKTAHIQDGAVTLQKLAPAVQPIVSVDGVSNPGGNVDLIQSGAITITPDDANNRITIGETHSAVTGNPHNTTAAQVGALVSVDGVSNAGGNVDLIQSGAITITPDDANNRITIGETHSATTGNPHNTTALQVGALPNTGGTLEGNLRVNGTLAVQTTSTALVVQVVDLLNSLQSSVNDLSRQLSNLTTRVVTLESKVGGGTTDPP